MKPYNSIVLKEIRNHFNVSNLKVSGDFSFMTLWFNPRKLEHVKNILDLQTNFYSIKHHIFKVISKALSTYNLPYYF